MKVRKKPVVIEALQWQGNEAAMTAFVGETLRVNDDGSCTIHTLEGDHLAGAGDVILKGVRGECYPIKLPIFIETYDTVEA